MDQKAFQDTKATAEAETVTKNQKYFIDLAKRCCLTPDDIIAGHYLLFGGNIQFYACLMYRKSPAEKLKMHNWLIAEALGETFLQQWGPHLSNMPWPLFPPVEELQGMNDTLMKEATASGAISGGGTTKKVPSVYKKVTGGTYHVPVDQGLVDLTPVETAFGAQQQQQWQLVQQIKNLETKVASLQQQLQRQTSTSQSDGFRGRARGQRRGGQWRGRGGRPRGGGEDDDDEDQNETARGRNF